MAVPRKLTAVPNAATRELWRIAERGATDELEDVLPQADVNARNEHGMTALMRAARHGRLHMARVLLENGADPNVTRNDNFTALSLAAFFGHSEIVDLLMSHGANAEVATRFGTSPYIWAKARSFGEVARSLEQKPVSEAKLKAKSAPEVSPVVAPPPDAPVVVRTLKDPPEIWDLVHEAPRNFNARSAFAARMGLKKGSSALLMLALLIVVGGAITAGIVFKDRISWPNFPAATVTTKAPPAAATTRSSATVPAPVTNQPTSQPNTIVPNTTVPDTTVPDTTVIPAEQPNLEINPVVTRRSRSFAKPRSVPGDVNNEANALSNTVQPQPVVPVPKTEARVANNAEPKKTNTPASSQMIAQPKNSPPPQQPKAKVIQWP